jgi:NarL family two-component system response regulator LiaR
MIEPARLLIIDDHDGVREALETRLGAAAELEVVGSAGCWKAGLQEVARLQPDVVLLEIKRADGEGADALRSLVEQCPATRVVVLTSYLDAEERAEALELGASRCLLKEIDTPQLVREIEGISSRGRTRH